MKILNEVKYAERLLKEGFIQKKYEFELKILAKYLYSQGKKDEELKKEIIDFCNKNIKKFNEIKYMKMIKRVCKYAENNSLFVIKPIRITQQEIDKIKTLNDLKIEKVAFTLLVLANINKQSYILHMKDKIKYINKLNEGKTSKIELPNISLGYYVNDKISNIFKMAKIYLKKNERNAILKKLIDEEFITMTKSCKYKILYVNHNTKKDAVIINNFDDFVLEYERLIGDNIGYCQNEKCNKPIRITSNKRKYCNKCAREIQFNQKKEWDRTKRNKKSEK